MVALLCGVVDLAVIDLWLAPEVLGEKKNASDVVLSISVPQKDAGIAARKPDAGHDAAPAQPVPVDAGHDAAPALPVAVDAAVVVEPPDAAPAPARDFRPEMFDLAFQQDRATIKSYHHEPLERAATLLAQHPQAVAVIEGHADASETKYGVNALIKRRVGKIERYLTDNGIAAERIRTVNRGAAPSANETEARGNRRVRIRVELP